MGLQLFLAALETEVTAVDQTLNTAVNNTVDANGAASFANLKRVALPSGVLDFWVHAWINYSHSGSNNFNIMSITDGAFNTLVELRTNRIRGVTGDTTALGDLQSYTASTIATYDLHFVSTALSFDCEVYIDGSIVADISRSELAPAWGAAEYIDFGPPLNGSGHLAELMASEQPTVGARLSTLNSTGVAGFHSTWIGDYTDVMELGVDLTTTISAGNVGDKESWFVAPKAGKVYDSTAIQGVAITLISTLDTGTASGVRPFIRSGGVDYPGPVTLVPNLIANSYTVHWLVNPATGQQFTPAELTAGLEIGLELV